MGVARGANAQVALAFEGTFGTAPSSGFFQIGFTSNNVGEQQELIADDILGKGRDPQAPDPGVIDLNGSLTIPVGVESIGLWLKLLLGAPTTTGTDPYTHVFNSGASSLLSASIENGYPEVPTYEMHQGMTANSLELSMTRGRGQKLTATVNLIGQSTAAETTSQAGTPTALSPARFTHFNGSISRNGTDLGRVTGATLTYSNNLDPVEAIRADGLIGEIDPGLAMVSGQITARFDSTALMDQARAGTSCALAFDWEKTADEKLTLAVANAFLSRPKAPIEGPNGIDVTYDWMGAVQSNGDPMLVATLINGYASYA